MSTSPMMTLDEASKGYRLPVHHLRAKIRALQLPVRHGPDGARICREDLEALSPRPRRSPAPVDADAFPRPRGCLP